MKQRTIEEQVLRRYLLGELSDGEQARQEERLLTEEQYFEQLLLIEDDLIDDYVRGNISQQDKERMEQYFLSSPRRRERAKLARGLRRYASENTELAGREQDVNRFNSPPSRFLTLVASFRKRVAVVLLASLVLLLMVGAAGLYAEIARLRSTIVTLSQEQIRAHEQDAELRRQLAEQTARADQLSQRVAQEQSQRLQVQQALSDLKQSSAAAEKSADNGLLSLALLPGRMRDAGQPSLIAISPAARWLRLSLSLERDGYKSYRAVLQSAEGEQLWSRKNLRARPSKDDKSVEIVLPAKLLLPGDYTVLLSPTAGRERIGAYSFTVVAEK